MSGALNTPHQIR